MDKMVNKKLKQLNSERINGRLVRFARFSDGFVYASDKNSNFLGRAKTKETLVKKFR